MIELKNVSKNYGSTEALVDVSLSVKKGEIIGFVGPNGAGKSTAMKIITTYTAPTSGAVTVGGFDVLDNHQTFHPFYFRIFFKAINDIV